MAAAHHQPKHPRTHQATERIIPPTTTPPVLVRTSPPHAILPPCTKSLWLQSKHLRLEETKGPPQNQMGWFNQAPPPLCWPRHHKCCPDRLWPTPVEDLCLRAANPRTRARLLRQVRQVISLRKEEPLPERSPRRLSLAILGNARPRWHIRLYVHLVLATGTKSSA